MLRRRSTRLGLFLRHRLLQRRYAVHPHRWISKRCSRLAHPTRPLPLRQLCQLHHEPGSHNRNRASYVPGKFGAALSLATGGALSYPASGNISFSNGTIELWLAPTKDGSDPIYSQYDHTLFRYTASNGDQLVLSQSANGSFYARVIIAHTFTGTGGIQISSLKANVWHHIAFTYSQLNSRIRVYLDGVQTGEKDVSFTMPAASGASFFIDSTASQASAFLVDELRISSDEKTAAQSATMPLAPHPSPTTKSSFRSPASLPAN